MLQRAQAHVDGGAVDKMQVFRAVFDIFGALLFYAVLVSYMYQAPRGGVGCLAAQVAMVPLFTPASLSLWTTLMPLMQMAYWQDIVGRGAIDAYIGNVPPGTLPWALTWLRAAHAALVGVFLLVYLAAAAYFAPLILLFGVPILVLLLAVVFGAMYVPLQVLSGKWPLCCCAFRCCHRRFKRL